MRMHFFFFRFLFYGIALCKIVHAGMYNGLGFAGGVSSIIDIGRCECMDMNAQPLFTPSSC